MRKTVQAVVILASFLASSALAETLDNKSIITMVNAGIGEDAILAKIRTSDGIFEISVQDLIQLKRAKVPSRIITEMIETSGKKSNSTKQSWSLDARDPLGPHPPGVYVLTNRSLSAKMISISPTISRRTKSGGFWSYALTGGIASMSFKAIIPGAHAHVEVRQAKPIFYFYFEPTAQSSASNFWASGSVNAPTDFALVRFDVKVDHREKKVGRYNITGIKSGLSEKDKIPFTYSLLGSGIFEVIPVIDLAEGEYGFVLESQNSQNYGAPSSVGLKNKIFDFSVVQPI